MRTTITIDDDLLKKAVQGRGSTSEPLKKKFDRRGEHGNITWKEY